MIAVVTTSTADVAMHAVEQSQPSRVPNTGHGQLHLHEKKKNRERLRLSAIQDKGSQRF